MRSLALLLAVGGAFWPVAYWVALRTRYASEDRWALLAWVAWAAAVVLSRARPDRPRTLAGPALLVLGAAFAQPDLPPLVSAVVAVVALTWTASLLRTDRRFSLPLFGLGLLGLPLVSMFQYHLGLPLRVATTEAAAFLLRLGGHTVIADGTCLSQGVTRVWVDPPCSGLTMLWTALFATCIAGVVWKSTPREFAIGSVFAVLLVLAANALRAATLFLYETRPVGLPDWTHDGVGLVLQAVVIALVAVFLQPRTTTRWSRPACS